MLHKRSFVLLVVAIFAAIEGLTASAVRASGSGISIFPTSGNWNYPGSFVVKNDGAAVEVRWFLDCWDHSVCSDSSGEETLQSGQLFTKGLGNICSKWQLDLWWQDGSWGGIAEKENCEEPPVCEWDDSLPADDPNCKPPTCETDLTLPECQEPPRPPRVIVREEPSPAGGLVCVTYTVEQLLPALYAQYFDASERWVSWNGWVSSTFKSEVELWELALHAHAGAPTTGRFLVSYESGQKTLEVSVDAGSNCVYPEPEGEPIGTTCPDCPPAVCLLQPGSFVKVANQYVGLTADNNPLVFATENEAVGSGLSEAGYECGLCAEHLVRGDTVFITTGSTVYDIAVALNIAEGSPFTHYGFRHMEEAQNALRAWREAGKVDGWYSFALNQ